MYYLFHIILYNWGILFINKEVHPLKLNQAISIRLNELLKEKNYTAYRLNAQSGVPKSTIGNILNCTYDSVKIRVLYELCQGLEISLTEFFNSPLFSIDNIES